MLKKKLFWTCVAGFRIHRQRRRQKGIRLVGGGTRECPIIGRFIRDATNIALSEREQWLSRLLVVNGGYQWEKLLFKMDLEIDGEIRIFNEGCNDSRDTRGTGSARNGHEPLECVAFMRCYFAGREFARYIRDHNL